MEGSTLYPDEQTFLAIHTRWQVMHPTIVTRAGTDAQTRPYRRSLRPDRKEETPAVIQVRLLFSPMLHNTRTNASFNMCGIGQI